MTRMLRRALVFVALLAVLTMHGLDATAHATVNHTPIAPVAHASTATSTAVEHAGHPRSDGTDEHAPAGSSGLVGGAAACIAALVVAAVALRAPAAFGSSLQSYRTRVTSPVVPEVGPPLALPPPAWLGLCVIRR